MTELQCVDSECNGRMRKTADSGDGETFACGTCETSVTIDLPPVLSRWANALAEGA